MLCPINTNETIETLFMLQNDSYHVKYNAAFEFLSENVNPFSMR